MKKAKRDDYSAVKLERIWDTIDRDLPGFRASIELILKKPAPARHSVASVFASIRKLPRHGKHGTKPLADLRHAGHRY